MIGRTGGFIMAEKDKSEYEVTLTLDGEEVSMMPFIEDILRDVVLGVVSNLKGYEEGQEVLVWIK